MPVKTTHVGSLPRKQEVVDFIFARENGEPYDAAAFDACMAGAVDETVRQQTDAGIDVVSDGETSKISYATYVKDRYTGFSGDSPRNAPADLKSRFALVASNNHGGVAEAVRRWVLGMKNVD